jgi:hypothetical protein
LLRWHAEIIKHRWCYPAADPDARLSSKRFAAWRWKMARSGVTAPRKG